MSYGVTPEGYVLKTQAQINAEAEANLSEVKDPLTGQELQADFSDPSDVVTQVVAPPLEGVGIAWEQNQAAYNAYDPGKATGDSLSNLMLIHGTARNAATQSTVLLDLTGTALGFVNEGFQVTDVNREIIWTTTLDFSFDVSGDAVGVPASCDTFGAITAQAGSIDKIVASDPGGFVSTVTNPSDAVVGQDEENDESARQRMDIANEKPANGLPAAINANIFDVNGVTFVREYTNKTLITDGNGIVGKNFAVVVVGGDDNAVAKAIFQSMTSGQDSSGNTAIDYVDNLGKVTTINFFRPENVLIDLEIDIALTGDEVFPTNGAELIKQAVVDYSTGGSAALGITDGFNTVGFPPGENVLLSRLYTPINSVPGHSITDVRVGSSLPLPVVVPIASDFTIDFNQVAVFSIASIVVSIA